MQDKERVGKGVELISSWQVYDVEELTQQFLSTLQIPLPKKIFFSFTTVFRKDQVVLLEGELA